ncbi:MAG: caspase family protein [Nitrospirae bacterium]|nr:caspase family protein [Nitrospirota bacterium]
MKRELLVFVCAALLISAAEGFAEKRSANVNVFPAPPNLSATVKFNEPSGNNILDAGETGRLILEIKNSGSGDAFDVRAEIKPDRRIEGLRFDRDISLGTIGAGQSITKEIELAADEEILSGRAVFGIALKEANGFDLKHPGIAFSTKAFEPPMLIVADIGVNDQNGNGKVEPMEIVELTVRVQNKGYGDAREVSVDIKPGDNVFMGGDGHTHFDIGAIRSGKFKDLKFMFYTNTRIQAGEKIPLTVQINESRPKFGKSEPLKLVMNAQQKSIAGPVVVMPEDTGKKDEIQTAGGLSIDVETKIPEGEKAGKYDVAVIIGNRNYSASGLPNVEFADRDARIMKEYLIKTFGYDPMNILYAEDATVAKFNELFGTENDPKGRLYKFVKSGASKVFIYYAGHGAPDLDSTEAYFVPVDANPEFIKANGYKLQTFYNNLSKVHAKKMTIVLDSCFSGNSPVGMLFKNMSPAMVQVKKEYRGPSNAVIITSAAIGQVSNWYPDMKHSLFTYYFFKALQGEADKNSDKKITIAELRSYLKEHVPYMAGRLNNREQEPVVNGHDSDVIVTLKK